MRPAVTNRDELDNLATVIAEFLGVNPENVATDPRGGFICLTPDQIRSLFPNIAGHAARRTPSAVDVDVRYDNDPVDEFGRWSVVGDLRRRGHPEGDGNYPYSDAVRNRALGEKILFTVDAEFSCSFFFCPTEDAARRIEAIINELVPKMWKTMP